MPNENLYYTVFDFYAGGKVEGSVWVDPHCPNCKRFIKMGEITIWLWNYHLEFKGFKCSKCGKIKPNYYRE